MLQKTRPSALGMSNPMMDLVRRKEHEQRGIRGIRRRRMEVENVWIRKIFDLQRRRKRDGNGGKYLVSGEEEKEMEKDDNIYGEVKW